jgi:hypothetical protein
MAIKLDPKAFKELKDAIRNYATKGRVEKLLTNIQVNGYKQGYADALQDASEKLHGAVDAYNESLNTSSDVDGVVLQSDGSLIGDGIRSLPGHTHSGDGSPEPESDAGQEPESV